MDGDTEKLLYHLEMAIEHASDAKIQHHLRHAYQLLAFRIEDDDTSSRVREG